MRHFLYVIPTALSLLMAATSIAALSTTTAMAQDIDVSVDTPPPELPDYDQPPIPDPDYIWTPGYWAYSPDGGYYWVPGTWVLPPEPNLYWTPAWWGFFDGHYGFHAGYWGPEVGFYGGIDYGYGYGGNGYDGGRWDNGHFSYNSAVNNFGGVHITNVYRGGGGRGGGHVSFNGGSGVHAQPSAQQAAAEHQRHVPATGPQAQHMTAARSNPEMRAATNHGRPAVAATSRPGEFTQGAVPARGGGGGARPAAAPTPPRAEGTRPGGTAAPAATPREPVPHAAAAPRPPRPAGEARPAATPRPQQAPRPAAAPRPPRPAVAPHPQAARPQAPRPQAPRPQAPHPAAAPHPAPAAHAAPKAEEKKDDHH